MTRRYADNHHRNRMNSTIRVRNERRDNDMISKHSGSVSVEVTA